MMHRKNYVRRRHSPKKSLSMSTNMRSEKQPPTPTGVSNSFMGLRSIALVAVLVQANGLSTPAQTAVTPETAAIPPPPMDPPPPPPLSMPPPSMMTEQPPVAAAGDPLGRRSAAIGSTWWDGAYSPFVASPTSNFRTATDESAMVLQGSYNPKVYTDAWWEEKSTVETGKGLFNTYTDNQLAVAETRPNQAKTFSDDWWEEKTVIETGVGMFETYTDKQRKLARMQPKVFSDDWWEEKSVVETGVGLFETYTDKQRKVARMQPQTYSDAWWEEKTTKDTGAGMFQTYTDQQKASVGGSN